MLVVLLIIAVLAGISFPLIRSGVRSSRSAGCLSNLRQIGISLEAYLQENNERMPVLEAGRRSKGQDIPVLETVLMPFASGSEMFCCPADDEYFDKTGSSYLWNTVLNGRHRTQLTFLAVEKNDSRVPLVADKEAWHGSGESGTNFLYADFSASDKMDFSPSR